MDLESIVKNEFDSIEISDSPLELFITIEVYIEGLLIGMIGQGSLPYETTHYALPKHLNTFSLVGLFPNNVEYNVPQERLDRKLAFNDPMFPRENTLVDWLQPVRYQQNKLGGTKNIFEGFGPRIRL